MLDSLFELIAAIFIAAIPILTMIGRRRRRKRAGPAEPGGPFPSSAPQQGSTRREEPQPRSKGEPAGKATGVDPRRLFSWLRRGRREKRKEERETDIASSAVYPSAGAASPWSAREKVRDGEDGRVHFGSVANSPTQGNGPKGDRLEEVLRPYPTLKRAILLREILGPPKGLE